MRFSLVNNNMIYLGIVIHLVWAFCSLIDFSNSSIPPLFFNFFTKLFTAFSLHLSSPSPFFHPNKRLTTGDANGKIEVILCKMTVNHYITNLIH